MTTAIIQPSSTYDDDLEIYNHIKNVVQVKLLEHEDEYVKITDAVQKTRKRVPLSLAFLNEIAPDFAKRLLSDPFTYLPPCEKAVSDVARQYSQMQQKGETSYDIKVALTGWLGSHSITPRGVDAELANKMVLVEGIITRCTLGHPVIRSGAYFVPELGRHIFREYFTGYTLVGKPNTALNMPAGKITQDNEGHQLELEFGLSTYQDVQFLTLQEMPEVTPVGQLPRTVEVVVEGDLVDLVKPGDRARVFGVLKSSTFKDSAIVTGAAKIILIGNNVERLQVDYLIRSITPSLIKNFQELATREDTLQIVASSIAPSICGHEYVRMGLALQLVGGVGRSVEGSNQRGDMHVLLIGDPSCGKSQLLRFCLKLAPLAISTTGRGSSAVGLTAAVVSDPDSGQKRLEAGAMVLADGGMVCIDEFDKMGPDDRVAVHEVMEQQRVTVMKANISATLNARTSVLAAANPVYGNFDDKVDFAQQVNFPDSLLSRFDLIFLIREPATADQDRTIARQVLSQLRATRDESQYSDAQRLRALRADVVAPTLVQPKQDIADKQINSKKALMWTTHPATNAPAETAKGKGKFLTEAVQTAKADRLIKIDFLKNYLAYCKYSVHPEITDEAIDDISQFYAYIRARVQREWQKPIEGRANYAKAIPTPRLLEALLRISTAHAKLKMKSTVDPEDVAEAKKLMLFSMCGYEDREVVYEEQTHVSEPNSVKAKRSKKITDVPDSVTRLTIKDSTVKRRRTSTANGADAELIWDVISQLKETQGEEDWELEYVLKRVQKKKKDVTKERFADAAKSLERGNRVMFIGSRIYIV